MRIMPLMLSMSLCFAGPSTMASIPLSQHDAFRGVIREHRHEDPWTKIHVINHFVNRTLSYRSDLEQYGVLDHWAGPSESLRSGAGDCEDYALAKYVALRAMGIPDARLRLAYGRLQPTGESHMVLHYISEEGQSPLVLDSLSPDIAPAHARRDLRIVYSFNSLGIWLPGKEVPFPPMTHTRWTLILKEISDTLSAHSEAQLYHHNTQE